MNDFTQALEVFLTGAQAIIDKEHNTSDIFNRKLSVDPKGKKYKRIVVKDHKQNGEELSLTGSVFCFVNMENGDVLKAAGWKSPAKGARSNIYNEKHGVDGVNQYGANYNYR